MADSLGTRRRKVSGIPKPIERGLRSARSLSAASVSITSIGWLPQLSAMAGQRGGINYPPAPARPQAAAIPVAVIGLAHYYGTSQAGNAPFSVSTTTVQPSYSSSCLVFVQGPGYATIHTGYRARNVGKSSATARASHSTSTPHISSLRPSPVPSLAAPLGNLTKSQHQHPMDPVQTRAMAKSPTLHRTAQKIIKRSHCILVRKATHVSMVRRTLRTSKRVLSSSFRPTRELLRGQCSSSRRLHAARQLQALSEPHRV